MSTVSIPFQQPRCPVCGDEVHRKGQIFCKPSHRTKWHRLTSKKGLPGVLHQTTQKIAMDALHDANSGGGGVKAAIVRLGYSRHSTRHILQVLVQHLVAEGLSYAAIGKLIGLCAQSVRRHAVGLLQPPPPGIVGRPRSGPLKATREALHA